MSVPTRALSLAFCAWKMGSSNERPAQCYLVGILKINTDRKPARQSCYFNIKPLELALDIYGGCLALNTRIGGQNNFFDVVFFNTFYKLANAQMLRFNTVNW
jgi:hypothetical protein